MSKKIFMYIFLIIASCVISNIIYHIFYYDKGYSNLDLSKVSKLMIVAHPDDEILWGGAHLIEDDYLVVCITCGKSKTRREEFIEVMDKTNDQYLMLGHSDKVFGKRSSWKYEYKQIYNELSNIIKMKNWDIIVTHNVNGEYGHIHHKTTNRIVTEIVDKNGLSSNLYLFGKYYTKTKIKNVEENLTRINDELLSKKIILINIYKSQDFIKRMFGHMNPYENWEKYVKD